MTDRQDAFKARNVLKVDDKEYDYYDINIAAQNGLGDISKLPVTLKILLENK